VLADANPGIIALRTSTLLSLEEAQHAAARAGSGMAGPRPGPEQPSDPEPAAGQEPPPNLGPPPERLDWRRPR
jgi:hypothetical protein